MITEAMVDIACNAYDADRSMTHHGGMRAALEAADRVSWRDIETAPKDGQAVLLLSAAHDAEVDGEVLHYPAKCHIGTWDPHGDSWTDESGGFEGEICTLTVTGVWLSGGGWFQPNEVTHWRPIPAPPCPTEEGET